MKLVILDRDGVINEDSDSFIKSPQEWVAIPGSLEAIAKLCHHGYKVVIASNQSGLARGLFSSRDLSAIHQKMRLELDRFGGQIDGIFFCPHGPDDKCSCRKPEPGLLLEIRERLGVEIDKAVFVGDSFRDIQAANAAGTSAILVKSGKGRKTISAHQSQLAGVPIVENLSAAVSYILAGKDH